MNFPSQKNAQTRALQIRTHWAARETRIDVSTLDGMISRMWDYGRRTAGWLATSWWLDGLADGLDLYGDYQTDDMRILADMAMDYHQQAEPAPTGRSCE